MTDKPSSPLPPLYTSWVETLLGNSIPPETRATCHDCAMCEEGADHQAPGSSFFNPRTKCCTYLPEIYNFLAGQILADDDPLTARGRATVEARINEGVAVTPLWLGRHPKYSLLYNNMEVHAFGRAQSLRCPHFIEADGLCGIWKNRNSICSTWFCRHERGLGGYHFWETAKNLLGAIEDDLSRWCVAELDIGEQALELLFKTRNPRQPRLIDLDSLENRANSETQRRIWGRWFGREQEFYRECARMVTALNWEGVLSVCGSRVRIRALLLKKSHEELTAVETPPKLRVARYTIEESGPDSYRLHPANALLESLTLSKRVLGLLRHFDGRPTTDVIEEIIAEKKLRITPELLRRLVDFRILTPCE
jgi:hypothetical protein